VVAVEALRSGYTSDAGDQAEGGAGRPACARANATCGELVQGVLGGRHFLITSPIDWLATATVQIARGRVIRVRDARGRREPEEYVKVAAAARACLDEFGCRSLGAEIVVDSTVPRGKGLASSSADINAAILATAEAAGLAVPPFVMARLATSIEPTDGVSHDGVVMFDHLAGHVIEFLGAPPPLSFVVVDTSGEVDTLAFDRERERANAEANAAKIAEAVQLVRRGFKLGRPELIGAGATISARCHQATHFKEPLEALVALATEAGACGVNCAHSGTVLGVMFDPDACPAERVVRRVEAAVGAKAIIGVYRLVGGGPRLVRSSSRNLTAGQHGLVRALGEPVNRIRVDQDYVLEFEHGGEEPFRLFGYPDDTVRLEHPDPTEGQFRARAARAPEVGEIWQMTVDVERGSTRIKYRPVVGHETLRPEARSLERDAFERAFEPAGDRWVRRVTILAVSHNEVVYAAVGEPGRKSLAIPVFLSNFEFALPQASRAGLADEAAFEGVVAGCRVEFVRSAVDPSTVVKTLLFVAANADSAAQAVVPADRLADPKKVAAALGLRPLRLASADDVYRLTGFEIGLLPPLGHRSPLPTVIDGRAAELETLCGEAGDGVHRLRIARDDLVRAAGARVADVTLQATSVRPPADGRGGR
jgi:L-threonine kinase